MAGTGSALAHTLHHPAHMLHHPRVTLGGSVTRADSALASTLHHPPDTLDQSQQSVNGGSLVTGPNFTSPGASGGTSLAQTFTAGLSGELDRIEIPLAYGNETASGGNGGFSPINDLTVDITAVDASGAPEMGHVLATGSVSKDNPFESNTYFFYEVDFAHPALVSAGTQYAIVAYASGTDEYDWGIYNSTPYPRGQYFYTLSSPPSSSTSWSVGSGYELGFETYVASIADRMVVSVSNRSPGVGASFTVRAVVEKGYTGLTDTSFNGPASWSDGSGQLSRSTPSSFVHGVSTTTVSVGVPYRLDKITVSSQGLSGASGPVNVIGPLTHFSFSPIPQQAIWAGFKVSISARDAVGNLITSYSGSPSWFDSSGSLNQSAPAVFAGGVSTNWDTQILKPAHLDKITVDDTSAGVKSSSNAFDVLGPFAGFSISGPPQPLAANQPFKLVVRAVDAAGNTVTGYSGSPNWSDAGNTLAFAPSGPAPFVDGVSVNSCASVGEAADPDYITVDDSGAGIQATSRGFDVGAAQVFRTPGQHLFTIPCAANVVVGVLGASGGKTSCGAGHSSPGGEGGFVAGGLTVPAGQQLIAAVGGAGGSVGCGTAGGAGGTGSGADGGAGGSASASGHGGAGGGGASALVSTTGGWKGTTSVLLVGGGGGGAGFDTRGGNADAAGGPQSNCGSSGQACGGGAGTSPGGTGGASDGQPGDGTGSNGALGTAGAGGGGLNSGGGGGGDGYYGGGGGGDGTNPGSGGGGQSFIASSVSGRSGPRPSGSPAEVAVEYLPGS